MNRERVEELHFITAIGNVPSIVRKGILCYREAQKLPHRSVAEWAVQEIRHAKQIPPGNKTVHDYANLYFDARNPMMFKRKDNHATLCVLRVDRDVLALPGVMVADQNAASKYVRYYSLPKGWQSLDEDRIYARDWTSSDQIDYWRRKSAKCAEVLVPDLVPPNYVLGAYVSGEIGGAALSSTGFTLPVTVNPDLFFQA